MGGFSILLVMLGTMSVFFFFMIAIFLLIIASMIITYIFESIALMKMSKNLGYPLSGTAWIPFYHKYILGKIAENKVLGIILAIDDMLTLVVWIGYCLWGNDQPMVGILFLVCVLISFILNIILTHKVYTRFEKKRRDIYTVLSVLTFGFLRPIFLFLVRNKKEESIDE